MVRRGEDVSRRDSRRLRRRRDARFEDPAHGFASICPKLRPAEPIKVSRLSTGVMAITKKRVLLPLLAAFALSAQTVSINFKQ
jgi:hypothetical protein